MGGSGVGGPGRGAGRSNTTQQTSGYCEDVHESSELAVGGSTNRSGKGLYVRCCPVSFKYTETEALPGLALAVKTKTNVYPPSAEARDPGLPPSVWA